MGGFWGGFVERMGQRANEQNLLELQQEHEERQAHAQEFLKRSNDSSYRPEAQQAALQAYSTIMSTKIGKKLDYGKLWSGVVNVPRSNVTFPGAPRTEGGPPDWSNTNDVPISNIPTAPGEPPIPTTQPGRYTPEQQAGMEASAAGMKTTAIETAQQPFKLEQLRTSMEGKVASTEQMEESQAAAMYGYDSSGRPLNPQGTGKITVQRIHGQERPNIFVGPGSKSTAGQAQFDPVSKAWYATVLQDGVVMPQRDMAGNLVPGYPKTRAVMVEREDGKFFTANLDPNGRIFGEYQEIPKPANLRDIVRTREQIADFGGYKATVVTTSTTSHVTGAPPKAAKPSPPPGVAPEVAEKVTPKAKPAAAHTPTGAVPPAGKVSVTPARDPKVEAKANAVLKSQKLPGSDYEPPEMALDPTDPEGRTIVFVNSAAEAETMRKQQMAQNLAAGTARVWDKTPAPMSYIQAAKNDSQIQTFNTTAEFLSELSDAKNIAILRNPAYAYLVKMAVSTSTAEQFIASMALYANVVPPEAQEAFRIFVSARKSIKEHIQTIRSPLGAAGFRSLEAFNALQEQAGMIMGDPRITQMVIQNTMRTVLALRAVHERAKSMNEKKPMIADARIRGEFLDAYDNNKVKATAAMARLGYIPPPRAK